MLVANQDNINMTEIEATERRISSNDRTKSGVSLKQQQKLSKQIDQINQQILEIARENREMFVSLDLIHHASILTASRVRLHEAGSAQSSVGSHQNESKINTPSVEEKKSVQLFSDELESREGTMPEALMSVFLEDVDFLYMRSYKELNEVF